MLTRRLNAGFIVALVLILGLVGCEATQTGSAGSAQDSDGITGQESVKVTVLSFVRAETDMTMDRYVKLGAFGRFLHIREPTPLDEQGIIRMNRDTQYSFGVFDLTEPLTISKPEAGDRMMSLSTANQDHSISQAIYGAGEFSFTQEDIGSRYVFVGFVLLPGVGVGDVLFPFAVDGAARYINQSDQRVLIRVWTVSLGGNSPPGFGLPPNSYRVHHDLINLGVVEDFGDIFEPLP